MRSLQADIEEQVTRYFIAFLLIMFGVIGAARADTRDVLALARICASEAGIQTDTEDCAAILSVLRSRAERMDISLHAAMRAYSRRSFDRGRTDHRRWIAHLNLRGERPEGWPPNARWKREAWLGLVDHARGLLASETKYPGVHHWGDRHGDLVRARRAGWTMVVIDGTKNLFWSAR